MPETHKDLPVLVMRSQAAFETWLAKHQTQTGGIWLKLAKKGSRKKTLSYEQAREAAIIWGWIEGLVNKWDDDFYVLRFTRRRKRSKWSQINREIAEQLMAEDRLTAPGRAEVQAAQADGRWDAPRDPSATHRQVRGDARAGRNALMRAAATRPFAGPAAPRPRPRRP